MACCVNSSKKLTREVSHCPESLSRKGLNIHAAGFIFHVPSTINLDATGLVFISGADRESCVIEKRSVSLGEFGRNSAESQAVRGHHFHRMLCKPYAGSCPREVLRKQPWGGMWSRLCSKASEQSRRAALPALGLLEPPQAGLSTASACWPSSSPWSPEPQPLDAPTSSRAKAHHLSSLAKMTFIQSPVVWDSNFSSFSFRWPVRA